MTTDAAKLAAMRRPNQISLSLLLILPSIAKAIIKITMPLPITPQAIEASTFGMNSDTADYRVMQPPSTRQTAMHHALTQYTAVKSLTDWSTRRSGWRLE